MGSRYDITVMLCEAIGKKGGLEIKEHVVGDRAEHFRAWNELCD